MDAMEDEHFSTFLLFDESTMMMHGHLDPNPAPHAHLPTIFVLKTEVSAWLSSLAAQAPGQRLVEQPGCAWLSAMQTEEHVRHTAGSPSDEAGTAASDSTGPVWACDSSCRGRLSALSDPFMYSNSSVPTGRSASAPQIVSGSRRDGPPIFVPEEDWSDLSKRRELPDSASPSCLSSASTIPDFTVPSPDSLSSSPPPDMALEASRAEEDPYGSTSGTRLFTRGALGLHDLQGSPPLDEEEAPGRETGEIEVEPPSRERARQRSMARPDACTLQSDALLERMSRLQSRLDENISPDGIGDSSVRWTEAEAQDHSWVEAFEQEEDMLLGARLWGQILEASSDESDEDSEDSEDDVREGAVRNCRDERCLERRAMAIKVPDEGSAMVDERPDFLHPLHPSLDIACRGWRARQPPRM